MAKQYDVLFRLLLIGDSGVGKTCLLCRFTDNEFHSSHISTIGVDFKMKTIDVDGIKVRIQIWDTAGQERYQTITKQYYRRAQGIFLVYDITSERSYQHIMKWASDVDEYAPDGVQKILIGNKADESQKRQVGADQGLKLAKEYGMDFFETSACTNINIKEENCTNEEILNSLKYVRPGRGFEPNFTLFQKCDVNGRDVHPVFAYLKDKMAAPDDNGASLIADPKFIIWSPVHRSDISWNFEKFLIGPEGEAFRRYSKDFQTINIEPDIQRLLKLAK